MFDPLLVNLQLLGRLLPFFVAGTFRWYAFFFVTDAKELLKLDPSLRLAKESVPRLEKLHNDKNEKMKEEAIGESFSVNAPIVCSRSTNGLGFGVRLRGNSLAGPRALTDGERVPRCNGSSFDWIFFSESRES